MPKFRILFCLLHHFGCVSAMNPGIGRAAKEPLRCDRPSRHAAVSLGIHLGEDAAPELGQSVSIILAGVT